MRVAALLAAVLAGGVSAAERPAPPAARTATAAAPRLVVRYQAPAKGLLSLALYDRDGVLVRSLLSAEPVAAGAGEVAWDATSDLGMAAASGVYAAKGVFFAEPPKLSWVMKVGKSGDPPWRTADGRGDWGGNLGPGIGLCSNATSIVLASACVEDNQVTGVQQMDADGRISLRYHTFFPWDQRSAAAMDGRNLYLAILKDCQELHIAEYRLGEPRGRLITRLPARMAITASGRWKGRGANVVDGLALTASRIYASVGANDELYIIDRASGAITATVAVPGPRGLAVSGDRLLIASGEQVLRYTLDGKPDGVAVAKGVLRAANALCLGADGSMWVGDSGRFHPDPEVESGSKQVHVFNAAGALVRSIGKAGGAPRSGVFDPAGFGDILGLCLAPGGTALMVNDVATGFSRTSRWSLDGKLERQWFMRSIEGNHRDEMNPDRPQEAVRVSNAFGDDLAIQAWSMDLAAKTWQPAWRYTMPHALCWQDGVVVGYEHGGNPLAKSAGHPGTWATFGYGAEGGLRTWKGRNYMLSSEGAIYLYAPEQAPRLVAMPFMHRCQAEGGRIKQYYDRGPNTWYAWADRNGDAKVSLDEMVLTSGNPLLADVGRMATCRFDANLDIMLFGLVAPDPASKACYRRFRLPLQSVTADGVPVYDWGAVVEEPALRWPSFAGGAGGKDVTHLWLSGTPVAAGGSTYLIADPSGSRQLKLPGIDGDGWWAGRNWRKKICRFDNATGRCLWAVGRRAPAVAERGQMYNPISLAGVAEDAVFAADAMGVVWAWDADGLFLGRLYHGPEDKKPDQDSLYVELMGSNVVRHLGRTWVMTKDVGTSVHELVMPQRRRIDAGTVTVTPEQAARAIPWDPDGLTPGRKPVYEVRRRPAQNRPGATKMAIDGALDGREGWEGTAEARIGDALVLLDGERLASFRAMYDDANLYLGWRVRAPNGPANAGSELPLCPFVSGAYVDACFAPDWSQPQRAEVRNGDVRVLLAQITGGGRQLPFHRGYWPKKAGGTGGETISSPAASLRLEQIAEIPGLQAAWKAAPADPATGKVDYTVEAAIPLAAVGLADAAGRSIGFDTSVGVANAAGDRRERAGHWGGMSEAAVVDRPGSHRLLPETWGTLVFLKP